MTAEYSKALDTALNGLDWADWLDRLDEATDADGYVERLGASHGAIFVEQNATLLVSFEPFESLRVLTPESQPMGWQLARALGWSHLCLACHGETWFRDPRVFGYFDRLVDDGFFEEFDQVIFYGAGSCGYAAAAFSVAAPGAKVLAIQPQATLDPRMTEWDDRFRAMRRTDFSTRYGYAPDMLDAADEAFVLYDPEIEFDAMHAALFARSNVTRVRMRFMGARLDRGLLRMNLLLRMLAQLSAGKLSAFSLAQLFRARRRDVPYLKAVLNRLEDDGRLRLVARLTQHVLRTTPGPRFRRSLRAAYERAEELGIEMPPREAD
ncbi:phosphoadenosine phosphosulfate reductase [Roseovarius aestuariivivens]|uniref:phosphoadenosine phosphosulfate reductase n=1 Tax=Roseovarius aestuariivivens TaxID=1888910 RepID=UPI0010802BF8|nr:phosphoadenosine phosphosulfate reductase [Roseovarius aestuariivivens]